MTTIADRESAMVIVDGDDGPMLGVPDVSPPAGAAFEKPVDTDEVVRLGDGHVSGVESLCVGESQ